jgi:hypothetical protein
MANEGAPGDSGPPPEGATPLMIPPAVNAENDPAVGKERLTALFTLLKIAKIVVVDDLIERSVDAAVVSRILDQAPDSAETLAAFFPDIDLSPTNELRFDQLTAAMVHLAAARTEELGTALDLFDTGAEASDLKVASQLEALTPDGLPLTLLTPNSWARQRTELIAETTNNCRTLFFFDQELNVDQAELGFAKGSDIIKNIATDQPAGFGTRWFCGILSHTLTKGDEVSAWRTLARDENIDLHLFMPISKENLSDASAFYGAVHRTVINTYTERMKTLSIKAFGDALADAMAHLADLDPIDFEHAVVKSSGDEGVSELETLIRLYGIIQKDAVKSHILKEETLRDFLSFAGAVKSVADIERPLPARSQQRLEKLRNKELYESGELINAYHDPLRNGDLFEVGRPGAVKFWVLIAQPCDLMVRSDGKRAREDNFKVAVLAHVQTTSPAAEASPDTNLSFRLNHFARAGAQSATVKFPDATPVDLRVLDLAVLSDDGKCEIEVSKPPNGSRLFPGKAWENRVKQLAKHYAKVAKEIETARTTHNDAVATLMAKTLTPPVVPGRAFARFGAYDRGKFTYSIRRCGRIREPIATFLLAAFSRYLARDAYEHDYSRAQ